MGAETVKSYCRICEAHCGIEVKIDENETILSVMPDKTHPISKGYACIKGAALGALHHDADRVNYPLKKTKDGWVKVSWNQALQEIGQKVRTLKRDHGARSLAMYTGNPTYFNFKNILFSQDFMKALGSPNLFSSHSIDANNKLYVSTQVYGRSMVHPIPDFENTKFLLCLGSNPMVSQMSFLQIPNAVGRLREIEQRDGRVIFMDPRKTETVAKVGEHVFIKPGTDVYLLLAFLNVLVSEYEVDIGRAKLFAEGVENLIAAADDWPVSRVAAICGIDKEQIHSLAKAYIEADGAAIYMSTGVNMGPFGSLAYWLVQGLSLLTGNLDSKGGMVFPKGAIDILQVAEILGIGGESKERTLKHGYSKVAGCFPVHALAEEIKIDHPEKIRALFVSAGNPLHSVPGSELDEAFSQLELVVAIDMYRSETAERADYILPATDMLERSDYPISWNSLQPSPYAQYTEALVPPKGERKEEWRIFSELAIACGAGLKGGACSILPRLNRLLSWLPGQVEATPDHILDLLLRLGGETKLSELKRNKQGVSLPPAIPGSFLGQRVPRKGGKLDFDCAKILADLPRLVEYESRTLLHDQDRLILIGQRERRSHNSWMHNAPHIKDKATNVAIINPLDAERLDIESATTITISSELGSDITLPFRISNEIMPGVISVPHGWGHEGTLLSKAGKTIGVNINKIIPGGIKQLEPPSGQAIMLSHPVAIIASA